MNAIKIGSLEPKKYLTPDYNIEVYVRYYGTVNIEQDINEAEIENLKQIVTDKLESLIDSYSGTVNISNICEKNSEINNEITKIVNERNIKGEFSLGTISLTDESKNAYKEAETQKLYESDPYFSEAARVLEEAEKVRTSNQSGPISANIAAPQPTTTHRNFCPNCGQNISNQTGHFCPNCGSNL